MLHRYERPSHFVDWADFDRHEYFVCFGQHRDSDTLTRSNHRTALRRLGGESETVLVIRDSHCMVGWVEAIYIHESDLTARAIAEQMTENIEGYPVLDEDDWSALQWEVAADYWHGMTLRERVDVCGRFHITPFAARRDDLPEDPRGGLLDYLADGV